MEDFERTQFLELIDKKFIEEAISTINLDDDKTYKKQFNLILLKKISLIAACVLLCVGIVIPIAYMNKKTPPVIIDNSKTDSCASDVESEPVVSEPIDSQPDEVSIPEDENVIGVLAYPNKITNNNAAIDRVNYNLYQELKKYENDQLFRIQIRFSDHDISSSVKYQGYDIATIDYLVDGLRVQVSKLYRDFNNEYTYAPELEDQLLETNNQLIELSKIEYYIANEIINEYVNYLNSIGFRDVEIYNGNFIVTTSKEKIIDLCKNDKRFFACSLGTNKRPAGYDEIIPTSLANLMEATGEDDLIEIAYSPIGLDYDLNGIDYKHNLDVKNKIIKYCKENNLTRINILKSIFISFGENNDVASLGPDEIYFVRDKMTKQQIYDLISQGVSFITDYSSKIFNY